jgi:hypothetical protein
MRAVPIAVLFALLPALAGCSDRDPVADDAKAVNLPPPANAAAPSPVAAPPDNAVTTPAPVEATPAAEIPAALHGRWGLSPADCMSNRGDAKGLLVITREELRFYESRAVPSADVHGDADSINGRFDFTGEGHSWSKFEALKRSGDRLTRTETDPAASFTYAKC